MAPLGTALTEDQLRLLWQMADEPILCFDGDEAGLKAAFRAIDVALPQLKPGKSLRFALPAGGPGPRRFHSQGGAGAVPQAARGGEAAYRCALAARDARGRSRHARAPRRARTGAPQRRGGGRRRRMSAATTRSRCGSASTRSSARAGGRPAAPFPAAASRRRGRPAPEPTGPSASLLSSRLVREGGRGAGPNLGDAVLIGVLLLHPEIAAERLEDLAHTTFSASRSTALARALSLKLAEEPGIGAAELHDRARGGRARRGALRDPRETSPHRHRRAAWRADAAHAANVWDDAPTCVNCAGTLSIERQAAAMALGRETSDVHLSRLRDIQEQDQRSLRPDSGDQAGDAVIVHPFKRR